MDTKAHIIAVANQKGGVGKTTTTVSLAGMLSESGFSTLVIDLDPHGSLTSYFGYDPETIKYTVYDIYQQVAGNQTMTVNQTVRETRFENLYLLPASTSISTLEKQFGGRKGMGLVLLKAIAALESRFDYVLIDCPPMLGMLMINALACCRQLVIPVQTEFLAIKGLNRMMRTLQMIERSLKKQFDYFVLPTMYDQRTTASRECLAILNEEHAAHMSRTVIPVDTKFRNASFSGKPISLAYRNTHGASAYRQFLAELGVAPAPVMSQREDREAMAI